MAGSERGETASGTLRRALVVEDDPSLRRGLERSLSRRCLEVRSCGSRAEAARLLRSFRPELLVLDLFLPDGAAWTLVEQAARRHPPPALMTLGPGELPPGRVGPAVCLRTPLTGARFEAALDEAIRNLRRGAAPG
jgi:CheY-like chemotaxis protein